MRTKLNSKPISLILALLIILFTMQPYAYADSVNKNTFEDSIAIHDGEEFTFQIYGEKTRAIVGHVTLTVSGSYINYQITPYVPLDRVFVDLQLVTITQNYYPMRSWISDDLSGSMHYNRTSNVHYPASCHVTFYPLIGTPERGFTSVHWKG